MREASSPTAAGRDLAVRRVRVVAWTVGAAAAGLSGGLSVVAAHAFKGRDGRATPAAASARAATRVEVAPAEHVPAISGAPAPLQAPAAPPAPAPPQPQPETSGGS